MRALVLQHADQENLGLFAEFLLEDGADIVTLQPARESLAIDLNAYDALWVLGGAVQVWQTTENPWLSAELDLIRQAVTDLRMPYFGICLGHQLLALALGGSVGRMSTTEVGLHTVERSVNSVGLCGLPTRFACFHWHGAEVTKVPVGAVVSARNDACAVQGLEWGGTALSVQFHPEIDHRGLREWFAGEGCKEALVDELGPDADHRMLKSLAGADPDLRQMALTIYKNWVAGFFA